MRPSRREGAAKEATSCRKTPRARTVRGPYENPASVRGLSGQLARLLRRHFADEEQMLWPNLNATAGRTRLHRLDREVRGRVRAMKKELDSYLTAVEDYLT